MSVLILWHFWPVSCVVRARPGMRNHIPARSCRHWQPTVRPGHRERGKAGGMWVVPARTPQQPEESHREQRAQPQCLRFQLPYRLLEKQPKYSCGTKYPPLVTCCLAPLLGSQATMSAGGDYINKTLGSHNILSQYCVCLWRLRILIKM